MKNKSSKILPKELSDELEHFNQLISEGQNKLFLIFSIVYIIYGILLIFLETVNGYYKIGCYIIRFLFPIIILSILIYNEFKVIEWLSSKMKMYFQLITMSCFGFSMLFGTIANGGNREFKSLFFLVYSSLASIPYRIRLIFFGLYFCIDNGMFIIFHHDGDDYKYLIFEIIFDLCLFICQFYMINEEEYWLFKKFTSQKEMLHTQKILEIERKRADDLLSNLLPPTIAAQLKRGVRVADSFNEVTILFSDLKGFTDFSSTVTPSELVTFLNAMYVEFDKILVAHGLYKVEIIGDAYFAVAGCPIYQEDHAIRVASAGQCFIEIIPIICKRLNVEIYIRVGMHTGPTVAGVVGIKDPRYHLFGDSVVLAEEMESGGFPGKVHCSDISYNKLKNDFTCTPRGFSDTSHGKIRTYFVEQDCSGCTYPYRIKVTSLPKPVHRKRKLSKI